jgi:hypothetical protein
VSEKLLPDLFYAEAFAPAVFSAVVCYAREVRTGLHFYVDSFELHEQLEAGKKGGNDSFKIPFVVKRTGLIFRRLKAYDMSGKRRIGDFRSPAGGGPTGDFYKDVCNAYQ